MASGLSRVVRLPVLLLTPCAAQGRVIEEPEVPAELLLTRSARDIAVARERSVVADQVRAVVADAFTVTARGDPEGHGESEEGNRKREQRESKPLHGAHPFFAPNGRAANVARAITGCKNIPETTYRHYGAPARALDTALRRGWT